MVVAWQGSEEAHLALKRVFCRRHRHEPAGWRCEVCHSQLCPDCAVVKNVCEDKLVSCWFCGALAKRIRVHRSAIPFVKRATEALLYPLNRWGIAAIFAFALLVAVLDCLKAPRLSIGGVFLWLGLFWLIRKTARGTNELTPANFYDLISNMLVPALDGILATSWLWVPSAIYVLSRHAPARDPASLMTDPIVWGLLGVAFLFAPMAFVMAAAGGERRKILNPFAVIYGMSRVGRDFLIAGGVVLLLSLGCGLAVGIAISLSTLRIPLLQSVLGGMLCIYFPIVMARILGLLLYARGDALNFGFSEEYYCDALPGIEARGTGKRVEPTKRIRPSSIELGPAPTKQVRTSVIELDPPELTATAELPLRERLVRALVRQELQTAFELYQQAPESVVRTLPASDHFTIGQYAASCKDNQVALRAFSIAARSNDQIAPRAMVVLARLYDERLGREVTAQRIYQAVIAKHPNTKAAEFAAVRLERNVQPPVNLAAKKHFQFLEG